MLWIPCSDPCDRFIICGTTSNGRLCWEHPLQSTRAISNGTSFSSSSSKAITKTHSFPPIYLLSKLLFPAWIRVVSRWNPIFGQTCTIFVIGLIICTCVHCTCTCLTNINSLANEIGALYFKVWVSKWMLVASWYWWVFTTKKWLKTRLGVMKDDPILVPSTIASQNRQQNWGLCTWVRVWKMTQYRSC